jgi:hypothetical protein
MAQLAVSPGSWPGPTNLMAIPSFRSYLGYNINRVHFPSQGSSLDSMTTLFRCITETPTLSLIALSQPSQFLPRLGPCAGVF